MAINTNFVVKHGIDVGQDATVTGNVTANAFIGDGSQLINLSYESFIGCYHKLQNINAISADTVYSFDWYTNSSPHINTQGVIVNSTNPTHIAISNSGVYKVFLEMQIKTTVNQNREAYLWLAKNGADISETAVKIDIKSGGGEGNYQLASKQWLIDNVLANDYIELRFAVSDPSGISLEYTPAQTSPYLRPAIPSATITITSV